MKVHIFTEGGKNTGLGHISRCAALYDEISSRGITIDFIIYGDVIDIDFLSGMNVINKNWLETDYCINNSISPNDYVIVDSYLAEKKLLEIIVQKAKRVLFIDDVNRIDYPKGIVVNPSLDSDSIRYPKNNEITYLLGAEYVILRSPFININRRKVKQIANRVMVTMGGSDLRNITPIIIRDICNKHPEIQFDVVICSNCANTEGITETSTGNIIFHKNVDGNTMKEIMLNADFAITAAGQTIYELLATQTPFIPIQIADNQSNNVNSLDTLNLTKKAIVYSSVLFLEELQQDFAILLTYETRSNLVEKYRNIIDGRGSARIVNKLIEDKENNFTFRKISASDSDMLYEWANDEMVRKNAFNPDEIDYENHKKWFQGKIHDVNTLIYIILKGSSPIGQIRIDIVNDYGIIDYSLASGFRGQGLGTNVLQSIGTIVKEDCSRIKELVGRVKLDNIPSQKAFENAGFSKENRDSYFEYQKIL